ncbi:MAG: hypothetical protein ACRDZ9_02980 [Acidimicrobiales bacterium]
MGRLRRAAALLALAGMAASCGGSDEAAPPEASAGDAPLRSTTTTAPPPPTLELVLGDPAAVAGGDLRMTAVAAGTDVVVAVGDGPGAVVWRSADGRSWERVALPPDVFPPGSRLADVEATSEGFVAVGGLDGGAAAWGSPDGVSWRQAKVEPGSAMTTVVTTVTELVAFGTDGGDRAVWLSATGRRWARAPHQPEVFSGDGPSEVVGAVDAGAGVVAMVQDDRRGPESWVSPDAVSWSVRRGSGSALLPADGRPAVAAVASGGEGLVAAGSVAADDGVDAAFWVSEDARSWVPVPHDEDTFGGDGAQVVTALARPAQLLVAVGTDTDDTGDVDAAAWTSPDGSRWQRAATGGLEREGDQHVVDVAGLGDTVVAVGWEETAEGVGAVAWVLGSAEDPPAPAPGGPVLPWQRVVDQPALWGPGEQRLSGVAAADGGFVAVGWRGEAGVTDGTDGAVWRSPDGLAWELAATGALGGPGDQRLLGVSVGGRGLVAVGTDGASAAVWTSADGAGWERVPHDEAVFGGPGDQVAEAVAAGPVGVVAAGRSGDDAAVWRSADGWSWAPVAHPVLGGPGTQAAHGVAWVEGLGLVAVGEDGAEAVAWTSPDGLAWDRTGLGPGRAAAVTGGEGAAAVAGSVRGDGLDAVVWGWSGTAWERRAGGELAGPSDQELAAVAAGDGLAVAVGRTDLGVGDDAAAWASLDAVTWTRSPHDEDVFGGDQAQRMQGLAVGGGVAVAVGWSGSTEAARDGSVWVAPRVDQGGAASAPL